MKKHYMSTRGAVRDRCGFAYATSEYSMRVNPLSLTPTGRVWTVENMSSCLFCHEERTERKEMIITSHNNVSMNEITMKCQYIKRSTVPNDTKSKLMQNIPNTNNIAKRYKKRFIVPNNKLISTNDKKEQPQQRQYISEVPSAQGRCLT
ncbi:unnamed protein product [Bodo saltans]|uniref:Uncharacterized protein n=1 Tax=Bodo saltans TaxID=75058 RepID=A0A0S4J726_BODSA|nr:unnamed protein product [Bodo saltans]|eukprot:CUG73456.1 unnamed protein product [Bodo saltans]